MSRIGTILFILVLLAVGGFYYYQKNIGQISIPKKETAPETAIGEVVPYLKAPEGFKVTYWAKDVPNARVMEFDGKGRMLVSLTSEGKIVVLSDTNGDGIADTNKTLVSGLLNPHGMAFRCTSPSACDLYVVESNALDRYIYDTTTATIGEKTKLVSLDYSKTDRHFTRSLVFLPSPNENTLLISVGSSCNVCADTGEHAKILAYDITSGNVRDYATGLRNAVFMTLNPVSGKVYATEMGRDGLGDNIPPDEIDVVTPPPEQNSISNFGWPICYGNKIHDSEFDTNQYIRDPCLDTVAPKVEIDAHSAPLGLSFIPEEGWPEEDWYNLLVAYHGSWNRSVPTGYKVVQMKFDAKGNYSGTEDFITGWLSSDGKKFGRPAGIKVLSGGVAYISDDSAGVIYKLSRIK